jgi:predicted nucleotidyltransferase
MVGEVHPAVEALGDALRERFGDSVCGVLFYGSCLRGGDPFDGLVDLYVIVESYRGAYRRLLPSIFNWLLPPNVYYLEAELDGRKVRAKYAVVSISDLQAGTSRRWFHSYLWARFAQPVGLAYQRDRSAAEAIYRALAKSVVTFVDRVLPVIPQTFDTGLLWREGLMRTYRAELRVEQKKRTLALIEMDRDYYEAVTKVAVANLSHAVTVTEYGYSSQIGNTERRLDKILWNLRTLQGKLLSVLRLSKALFTFVGGVEYIVWKLERHSGESIEVPERVRRAPLIFGWRFFWNLYRKGVFR